MTEQLKKLFKKAYNMGAMYEATYSEAFSFSEFLKEAEIEQLGIGVSDEVIKPLFCSSCGAKLKDTDKDVGLCFECAYDFAISAR